MGYGTKKRDNETVSERAHRENCERIEKEGAEIAAEKKRVIEELASSMQGRSVIIGLLNDRDRLRDELAAANAKLNRIKLAVNE